MKLMMCSVILIKQHRELLETSRAVFTDCNINIGLTIQTAVESFK